MRAGGAKNGKVYYFCPFFGKRLRRTFSFAYNETGLLPFLFAARKDEAYAQFFFARSSVYGGGAEISYAFLSI